MFVPSLHHPGKRAGDELTIACAARDSAPHGQKSRRHLDSRWKGTLQVEDVTRILAARNRSARERPRLRVDCSGRCRVLACGPGCSAWRAMCLQTSRQTKISLWLLICRFGAEDRIGESGDRRSSARTRVARARVSRGRRGARKAGAGCVGRTGVATADRHPARVSGKTAREES